MTLHGRQPCEICRFASLIGRRLVLSWRPTFFGWETKFPFSAFWLVVDRLASDYTGVITNSERWPHDGMASPRQVWISYHKCAALKDMYYERVDS